MYFLRFAVLPFLVFALSTPAGAIGVGAVRVAVEDCGAAVSSSNEEVDILFHNVQGSNSN